MIRNYDRTRLDSRILHLRICVPVGPAWTCPSYTNLDNERRWMVSGRCESVDVDSSSLHDVMAVQVPPQDTRAASMQHQLKRLSHGLLQFLVWGLILLSGSIAVALADVPKGWCSNTGELCPCSLSPSSPSNGVAVSHCCRLARSLTELLQQEFRLFAYAHHCHALSAQPLRLSCLGLLRFRRAHLCSTEPVRVCVGGRGNAPA